MDKKNESDVLEIDLMDLLSYLLRYVKWIAASVLGAAILGFAISNFMMTEVYQSEAKIIIINKESDSISYSDVQLNSQLIKDYAELIKSRYVLEKVMEQCGVKNRTYQSFAESVTVENPSNTRILTITVEDTEPVMAKKLANSICDVASVRIKEIMNLETVNVVDEAYLPTKASSPSVAKWTLLGGILGGCVCVGILLVLFLLDDTIKTSDDVEKYLGLYTLVLIPLKEETEKKGVNTVRQQSRIPRQESAIEDLDEVDKFLQEGAEVQSLKNTDEMGENK